MQKQGEEKEDAMIRKIIHIDEDKCNGCGLCAEACHEGAIAMVDGKIEGLITDGDIRRAMEKWQAEFFDRTVSDIMTRNPKTVTADTKITEIQKIMNKYKVHSVLVVDDDNHLLGVVDHYSCMI